MIDRENFMIRIMIRLGQGSRPAAKNQFVLVADASAHHGNNTGESTR